MTDVAGVNGAGWYPDPLDPARRRAWDGAQWTARVSAAAEPIEGAPEPGTAPDPAGAAISWTPGLAAAPAPADLTAAPPVVTAAVPTAPVAAPLEAPETRVEAGVEAGVEASAEERLRSVDPIVAAFGDEARPPEPESQPRSRSRRPLVLAGVAALTLVIAGAAVAGAELMDSGQQRPQVAPEQAYRDPEAGFALRYPDGWRVLRRDEGDGVRFAIGAPDAPTTETNTVSVVAGPESAPLPLLHTLADQLTETLREQLPGVRLESAERTRLADAPAFRLVFRDPEATPPTRIEQYVGRTTSGRPLTVTVTIREPRTAPAPAELDEFVASLDPS